MCERWYGGDKMNERRQEDEGIDGDQVRASVPLVQSLFAALSRAG